MKKLLACLGLLALVGCSEADVASSNISRAADNFEITRRIIFYNGITDVYMLTIEGQCSYQPRSVESGRNARLLVTCKTGPDTYKRHTLGLSDNVTYFAEQMEPAKLNPYHYRVIFRPSTIIPYIEIR